MRMRRRAVVIVVVVLSLVFQDVVVDGFHIDTRLRKRRRRASSHHHRQHHHHHHIAGQRDSPASSASKSTPLSQSNAAHDSEFTGIVAAALEKGLQWTSDHLDRSNVNLLFGIRCVQGALGPDRDVRRLASELHERVSQDPTFSGLQALVAKPVAIAGERLLPNLKVDTPVMEGWTRSFEKFSDRCIHSALECRMRKECTRHYFNSNSTEGGYQLSHKLLYFFFMNETNCDPGGGVSVDAHLQRQVVAMYKEQAADDKVYSDLFAERVGLGGQLGYSEFLRPEWIRMIVEAQRSSGCWDDDVSEGGEGEDVQRGGGGADSDEDGGNTIASPQKAESCDVHTTSVSMIPLAAFLHFVGYQDPSIAE